MAKLISLKQQEGHDARATAYIKAYMLFPAGILGLISMIGEIGRASCRERVSLLV